MNFLEYERQKVKNLDASEVTYKMFKNTGNINHARLLLGLTNQDFIKHLDEGLIDEHEL